MKSNNSEAPKDEDIKSNAPSIEGVFNKAKQDKIQCATLLREAQQRIFEQKIKDPSNRHLKSPDQIKLHYFTVPGLSEAKAAYQSSLLKFEESQYNDVHIAEGEELLATLEQRITNLKGQEDSSKSRLIEISSELEALSENQTNEAATALAAGNADAAQAIESQTNKQRRTLRDEQETLENKLPALIRAIDTLQIDTEVCRGMLEHINKGITIREYRDSQQQFHKALEEFEPAYRKCLSLAYQAGESNDCLERKAVQTMVAEAEREQTNHFQLFLASKLSDVCANLPLPPSKGMGSKAELRYRRDKELGQN